MKKIGIIHFTDLHFQQSKNWIDDKISNITFAILTDFIDINKVFIVITGDIANKGCEYKEAEMFLAKLKKTLERFLENVAFSFVIVPGNHDCNFTGANQVREIVVSNIPQTDFTKDDSVIDTCLQVQDDFWIFYQTIIGNTPSNKLVFQIKETIEEEVVCFNCYNTAWMSSIEETVGKMFFPVSKVLEVINDDVSSLTISVFHHSLNWFTPHTEPNNKKEFSNFLEESSQILMYGHEHEDIHTKSQNIKTQKETIYISGKVLQNNNNNSNFNTLCIDISEKNGHIKEYKWSKDKYTCELSQDFSINGVKCNNRKYKLKQDFYDKINILNFPLKFEIRKNVGLSDIFVYPDLEKISTKERSIDEVYGSKKLLHEGSNIVSLEGDNQSGKTSLLNMLYLDYLEIKKYPLLIDAKSLLKYNDKILRKFFDEQYEEIDFESYQQLIKDEKILLIDDLQEFTHNAQTLIKIIKELSVRFGKIIITTTTIFKFTSALNAEFNKIDYFFIQPLGYKKRNELIEKYHILNESPQTITDQIILEKTKFHFDQIQTVLGNKLIPSYPVYILSILQTLIYATPHNLEQTSLGYCYQSLLYIALVDKAKVKNNDIDSYFNFLSELAFNMFQLKIDSFNEQYFNDFYTKYRNKYIAKNLNAIMDKLLVSNILIIDEDGDYKFKYDYIFYFLISKKLAELIHEGEGKDIIKSLCDNLSDEKSANILILTTHHSKDNYLIDEATLSLMMPYDSYTPITLEINDKYYEQIKEIVKEISSNIIQTNNNPKEERQKILEANDRIDYQPIKNNDEFDNEEYNRFVEEMVHALKAIEIVGQIVKNRKGSLDREKLTDIVTELYNTAFRTIMFFGEISKLSQKGLVDSLKNKIEEGDSNQEIEHKIATFFQYMTFQQCLATFSRIIYSVGNKDLKEIFDIVANEKIKTTASKIVTFSIKSCYGKVSLKELKTLVAELKNNPVAMSILRARVRAYVYHNYIDHTEKQQIASIMHMKLLN